MAAQLWFKDVSTWREAKEVWFNDSAIWREAKEIWINDSATWRQVYTKSVALAFSSFNPTNPLGSCNHFGGGCTANVSCTVLFTGGAGSPTYSWTYVSGVSFTIANSTTATANFSDNSSVMFTEGVYKCTVTDGAESFNQNVTIKLNHINLN